LASLGQPWGILTTPSLISSETRALTLIWPRLDSTTMRSPSLIPNRPAVFGLISASGSGHFSVKPRCFYVAHEYNKGCGPRLSAQGETSQPSEDYRADSDPAPGRWEGIKTHFFKSFRVDFNFFGRSGKTLHMKTIHSITSSPCSKPLLSSLPSTPCSLTLMI